MVHFYAERKTYSESDRAFPSNCQLTETTEDRGTLTTPKECYGQNPDNGKTLQVKESNFRLAGGGGRARDYKRLKRYPNQSQHKDCVYILTLRIRKRKGKRSNMYANVKLDICTINVGIYSHYLFFKFLFFFIK